MSLGSYHTCVVLCCKSTTVKTPKKLWIKVPMDPTMRKTWLTLARRDPESFSDKSNIYFCEDHFDLENDMVNYIKYKVMGYVKKNKMKPQCIPTRFDCQERIEDTASSPLDQDSLNAYCRQKESAAQVQVTSMQEIKRKSAPTEPALAVKKQKKSVMEGTASLTSNQDNCQECQDPLRKPTDQCRFCGEDSKDYIDISSDMPYLAGNMITLALNDTSVQLDFNDGLPNTICTNCDNKLQEYCDFIKTVKTAQETLKRKIKSETEDVREAVVFIKTEAPDEEEMNSISISDTVFVKNTVNYKRKGGVTNHKAKFAKNVMVESENEMIFDIKEEVVDHDEHIECSVESENELLIDIKQEIVNDDKDMCSRLSDVGSETSIPHELKYTVVSEIDKTLMIRKERTGSATTVNATSAPSPKLVSGIIRLA